MTSVYVPVLKGRNAELAALSLLDEAARDQLTPLIELPAGAGTDDFLKAIRTYWGQERPFYLDLVRARTPTQTFVPKPETLAAVSEGCQVEGLRMTPVITLSQLPEYQISARDLGKHAGLMLRLQTNVLVDPHALQQRVRELVTTLDLRPELVDLMVDLGSLAHGDPAPVVPRMQDVLELVADVGRWRTLIFASTSFPKDLSIAGERLPNHVYQGRVPRTDWELWRQVGAAVGPGLSPRYGDYAIRHPVEAEPPETGSYPLVPNVRYATDTEWLLLRGRDRREHDSPTFRDLCQALVAQPEFMGASFSRGDEYLRQCADGVISALDRYPEWHVPGLVHHMTLVLRQLAGQRFAVHSATS